MASPEATDPRKETILLHNISPELEQELLRRARGKGSSTSQEAAEIIERHVEDNEGDGR